MLNFQLKPNQDLGWNLGDQPCCKAPGNFQVISEANPSTVVQCWPCSSEIVDEKSLLKWVLNFI